MKIRLKTSAAAAALIVGIISAPAAYAHETSKPPASMMDQGGMMQGGQMMDGQKPPGMMQGGHGVHLGRGGMMDMMGQMSQMMGTCNQMMQAMMEHRQEKSQNPGQTPEKHEG